MATARKRVFSKAKKLQRLQTRHHREKEFSMSRSRMDKRTLAPHFRRVSVLAATIFLVHGLAGDASGQTVSKQQHPKASFADQLWNYLLSNNYKHWSAAPGNSAAQYRPSKTTQVDSDSSYHGPLVKSYVNRTASANPTNPNVGSILVLESYRNDESLESVYVMYQTEGYNPQANDWYWVKYNPDGSVAQKEKTPSVIATASHSEPVGEGKPHIRVAKPRRIMGRVNNCIQCHRTAASNDFLFFNDGNRGGHK